MIIQSWAEVTYSSLLNIWQGLLSYLPSLLGAIIVLVIGLIVAAVFRTAVDRVMKALRLDSLLRKVGLNE